jgi:hypothetical protein
MVRSKIIYLAAALGLLIASCSTAATPTATTVPSPLPTATVIVPVTVEPTLVASSNIPLSDAEVPRVSVEDTAAALKSGEAIVVDVRDPQAYQASHIPGAVSISLGDIMMNPTALNLDKDKWIITYCT